MNPAQEIDLSTPIRPLTERARSYELLDLGLKPIGRYPLYRDALEAIREWPRRTVFVLRIWDARDGAFGVEKQWLISLGLDGRYRAAETRKHWTMRENFR